MGKFVLTGKMSEFVMLQRTSIKADIGRSYYSATLNDYRTIDGYVNNPKRVLDIGCGMAGVDYFIAMLNPDSEIYLRDKTQLDDEVFYGFKEKTAFYNSLELAEELLRVNGVTNTIVTEEAKDKNIECTSIDLVISLISWGFHYPVDYYFKSVMGCLSKDGVVILDIRNAHLKDAKAQFNSAGFTHDILMEKPTYKRIAFFRV